MAVGGPETDLALGRTPLDIEGAQLAATQPAMAIVGQNTPQVTTRQAPQVPASGGLSIEMPQYAWQPSQADLGQRQVAQIGVDGFNVPVAQRGLPIGAIASRQQALAERKAKLQEESRKLGMAFDPFKGISPAADPYLTAQNKFITSSYNKMRSDLLGSGNFAGEADVDRWLRETPEGGMYLHQNFTAPQDALARENKGRFERASEMMNRILEGKTKLSPEQENKLRRLLNAVDPTTGVPFDGTDASEFRDLGREADEVMFEEEYAQRFLKNFDDFGKVLVSQGRAKRLPGNKFTLVDQTDTAFDDFIDSQAQSMVDAGIFTEAQARDFLEKRIKPKTEIKRDIYAETFTPERRAAAKAASGDGGDQKSFTTVSVVKSPTPSGSMKSSVLISPWQTTGGKPHKVAKASFNSTSGPVDIYAPSLTWNDEGHFFISGSELGRDEEVRVKQAVEGSEGYKDSGESDVQSALVEYVTTNKVGKPRQLAASNNSGEMKALWGTPDPYEVVAIQLRENGWDVDASRVRAEWSKPESRARIKEALSAR